MTFPESMCARSPCDFSGAIDAARDADLVIVFIGSSSKGSFNGTTHLDTVEKEGMDRSGEWHLRTFNRTQTFCEAPLFVGVRYFTPRHPKRSRESYYETNRHPDCSRSYSWWTIGALSLAPNAQRILPK